jgi:undecaprenyl-diphosphatase
MTRLDAIILGLVEGFTEFLPISSTGHLILTRSLLGLEGKSIDGLLIVIQGAAVLAVCYEYRRRLWNTLCKLPDDPVARRFGINVAVAFLPLAALGFYFGDWIENLLFAPLPVAIALIVGGALILWAERRKHIVSLHSVDDIGPSAALKIGFFQALALIPGTSRAAATILGGLLIGMRREVATEFSFFVAIPTLLIATAYKLWQMRDVLDGAEIENLLLSSVVSFLTALITIRWLLRFVSRHSFVGFAWYRIAFGGIVILTDVFGLLRW